MAAWGLPSYEKLDEAGRRFFSELLAKKKLFRYVEECKREAMRVGCDLSEDMFMECSAIPLQRDGTLPPDDRERLFMLGKLLHFRLSKAMDSLGTDTDASAAQDLLPAKQIRDLLPDLFPSWKAMKKFLDSHPDVKAEQRGQHWYVDLTTLVQARLRDQTAEITDQQIDVYLAGAAKRKADIDAARHRPKK